MEQTILPITNESGYYEIRLESIGGLGANLCGKMLGELGVRHLGLNSASFSSYGSEKTGTPVKAYIRYSAEEKEIREHSPVRFPHLLGIFHEALLEQQSVWEGCSADTCVVVHTDKTPQEIREQYLTSKGIEAAFLYTIAAQQIAQRTQSRMNVILLGAVTAAMGFVPLQAVRDVCKTALGAKYPDALAANLAGIQAGYSEVRTDGIMTTHRQRSEYTSDNRPQERGYKTALPGGINSCFGNSVTTDLSASRQGYIPIFRPEKCIHCGLCDSTCPDYVFQFAKGEYNGREMMLNKGLDYYHCKGCLRCVRICPTQALIEAKEADYPQKPYFLPNQDLIRMPEDYEKSGPNGYITSESYLTEKRLEEDALITDASLRNGEEYGRTACRIRKWE